jgi:LacI family transcriptional regulator
MPEALKNWQPEGIVAFVDGHDDRRVDALMSLGKPLVVAARTRPRRGLAVVIGNAAELYRLAHRHFESIGVGSVVQFNLGGQAGEAGVAARYRAWCREYGRGFRSFAGADEHDFSQAAEGKFERESVTDMSPLMAAWLASLPPRTGVFCQDSYGAWYLLRYCELLKIPVPERLAVVGVDDFHVATKSRPPASAFRIPGRAVGARCGEVVVHMIAGEPAPNDVVVVDGIELVARASTRAKSVVDSGIDEALRYIDRFACRGITVNDVVEETQVVSRMTFHKRFAIRTGATPKEWILNRQMSEARHLLADTEISIGSIAELCGFSEPLYFYKVFRKQHGVAPRDYRRFSQSGLSSK